MLCVGLNPKMELNRLLSLITESRVITHAALMVETESKPIITPNGAHYDTTGNRVILRNKLLSMLDIPRNGCGQHHIATPTPAMVLAGCSAILQFIGVSRDDIPKSLINIGGQSPNNVLGCDLL